VDIAPVDPAADPARRQSIVGELGKFSEDLPKPRWLVLNKSDLLPPGRWQRRFRLPRPDYQARHS
jgi:hypothetical protein